MHTENKFHCVMLHATKLFRVDPHMLGGGHHPIRGLSQTTYTDSYYELDAIFNRMCTILFFIHTIYT